MSDKNDNMGKWLEMLSDEHRADVMKTQIKETEQTSRTEIEQRESTKREDIKTDGYHGYRITAIVAVICAIAAATCVGNRVIEVKAATQQK